MSAGVPAMQTAGLRMPCRVAMNGLFPGGLRGILYNWRRNSFPISGKRRGNRKEPDRLSRLPPVLSGTRLLLPAADAPFAVAAGWGLRRGWKARQ